VYIIEKNASKKSKRHFFASWLSFESVQEFCQLFNFLALKAKCAG
jgi:hypothetical protein